MMAGVDVLSPEHNRISKGLIVDFSSSFHGKDGLDLIHKLCSAELSLLEQMEGYAERRAKLDSDYADKLNKLHQKLKFPEDSTITQGSLIGKAWRTYMTESENKAITISTMSKTLSQQTIPRIKTLHSRKKDFLENFELNRNRIERDLNVSVSEKTRLESTYKEAVKDAAKWREKLDESYSKVKAQKDWHKLKTNLDNASRKLHMNHNDYFLSVNSLNQHNIMYRTNIVPLLLSSVQSIQEQFVEPWKDIVLDMQANTSWCREEFASSEKEVKQSIEFISTPGEYEGFVKYNRQNPVPTIPYLFETTLLQDKTATSGLAENELAINDLTHKQLETKKEYLEKEHVKYEGSYQSKIDDMTGQEKILQEMVASDNKNAVFSTIQQCAQCYNLKLEAEEYCCKASMMMLQKTIVDKAVEMVSVVGPQPYIFLDPPCSATISTKSSASSNSPPGSTIKNRTSTLPKIFEKMKRKDTVKKRALSAVSAESDNSDASYDMPYESDSLEAAPWFHGKIDRVHIQRLLKQDGDFLVREKSDGSGINVLSVLWKGHTKHFILKEESGFYKLEAESFPTIPTLINHHHDNRLVIQASTGIILIHPIKRAFIAGDQFTIPSNNVLLNSRLGSGHFGDVWRGTLVSSQTEVAVKTCKQDVGDKVKESFLQEAEIMKPCHHKNVVKLLGVAMDREPFYIVLELCEKGDLLNVLKREGVRIETNQQYRMAVDIAEGMAYLEKKQIIHRDLAARNCLVKTDYTVKISDFGMSREQDDEGIYTIAQTKEIPFKWCAPEVWHFTTYSTKSDVWAYGVTLWEIFSLGNTPYPGWNNKHTKEQIDSGYRMQSPNGTPPQIFQIMQSCWNAIDSERPHFSEIVAKLHKMKGVLG